MRYGPGNGKTDGMSSETAVIILAVIGTGAALGLLIVPGQRELRRSIANLCERTARVEGAVETLRDTIAGRQREAARE